ncbi:Dual specificity phosphatase [Thalictrum thalictroides]|uniref:Dual specificity phosphatase n=1 Tax=Thalictrum thalictroides TaxID=46969 RepID=A0A7J6V3Z2_THATH|nr:Dual specificity phosphatase [Thalictrum thalictroides]
MADMEEMYRNKVATILKAFYASKRIKDDNVPSQIEEGLFLGSLAAACDKDTLKSLNITHILTVAQSLKPAYPNDFICKKIEVADRPESDIAQHFDECFHFIDEAKKMGGAVLVHCFAGKSRSVTIIVAYLMRKCRMTLSQALVHVKSKRPQVVPNAGFLLQLQNFEISLRMNEDAKNKEKAQQEQLKQQKAMEFWKELEEASSSE